jgi:PAS domain S-box-containing protein
MSAMPDSQPWVSPVLELFHDAPIGVAILDSELRYVGVNDTLGIVTGISSAERLGRTIFETGPDSGHRVSNGLLATLQTGTPARFETQATVDGESVFLDSIAFRVEGPNGRPHIVVVVDPATERVVYARNLEQNIATTYRLVRSLQAALLPPPELPTIPGVAIAGRYLAGGEAGVVGGDWYATVPIDASRLGIGIGDVAGHGLAAVQLMAEMRFGLRAFVLADERPGRVLSRLNRLLGVYRREAFVTAVYGVVDVRAGTATLASAGHLPPLVRHANGEVATIEHVGGPALGVLGSPNFPEHTIALNVGDTIVLYTDGLIERRDRSIDDAILAFADVLAGLQGDVDHMCDEILGIVLDRDPPADDVALVVARIAD